MDSFPTIGNVGIGAFLILAILFIALLVFIANVLGRLGIDFHQRQIDAAGRRGEIIVTDMICRVLRQGDLLFTNVQIEADGKKTELDNIIVNRQGIFIIEAKNYSGTLEGTEEDREWIKYHESGGGNIYVKTVRNPIPQVKRQVYILSTYLKEAGIRDWIDGYIVLVEANSPVNSRYILESLNDIDRAIHPRTQNKVSVATMRKIETMFDAYRWRMAAA